MTTATATAEQWLTRLEAAAYLRIHPITLDRWATAGYVTRHRIKNTTKTRYLASELDNLLEPLAPGQRVHGARNTSATGRTVSAAQD